MRRPWPTACPWLTGAPAPRSLYPFVDEPDLAPLLPALRAAAARERPFTVTLGRLGLFKRRVRSTLWLALDAEGGADRVERMMGRFDAAVGNPRPGPPVPHLTLVRNWRPTATFSTEG